MKEEKKKKPSSSSWFPPGPDTRGRSSWLNAEITNPCHWDDRHSLSSAWEGHQKRPLYIILAGIYKLSAAYDTGSSHFPFLHVRWSCTLSLIASTFSRPSIVVSILVHRSRPMGATNRGLSISVLLASSHCRQNLDLYFPTRDHSNWSYQYCLFC